MRTEKGRRLNPRNPFRYSLTTRFKDRHFLRLLDPCPGERVLDIGCGIGYLCDVLAREGDASNIFGVDPSYESIVLCRQLSRGHFAVGNGLALPFGDKSFDCVAIADVIEHLSYPEVAMSEIRRVIKTGGRLVLSTPALEGPLTRTRIKTFLHEEHDTYQMNHREGFYRWELYDLFRRYGFSDLRTVYTNVFVTELLLGVTKLGYRALFRRYTSQADAFRASSSPLFLLNRFLLFPIGYLIGRIEEFFIGKYIGHCSIIFGRAT